MMTTSTNEKNANATGNYASINGLDMYYEIHGTGAPLILLQGCFMTIDSMGQIVPDLARTRQVIAVELQGHGHTADIDRSLTFEQGADDVATLIKFLGLERPDVFGFSCGGNVALQIAIRHPEVIRKLVVAGAPCRSNGEYPEIRALMATFTGDSSALSPMREAYIRTAPKPEAWPQLVAKARLLLTQDYDWTQDVATIQAPTLIVVGDADTVVPAHALEMFELLGGGTGASAMGNHSNAQLAILPGTTHFTMLNSSVDLLRATITTFLDAPVLMAK
jgi:pimeloyl-ACP methyl ester carboxylesterase